MLDKLPDCSRITLPFLLVLETSTTRFEPSTSDIFAGYGTHSIWINEQLRGYGHEMIVANVRELHPICRNDRKSDRVDAEKLARFARLDPKVLRPITHRSVALQESLAVIRAREVLVRLRTSLINATRGPAKPCGFRLPSCSTRSFHKRCPALLPDGLKPALKPLIDQITQITEQIQIFDKEIDNMADEAFSGNAGAYTGIWSRHTHGSDIRADCWR
jgi:transposase